MVGVSKSFGSVQANRDVDFEVRAGEIHALLGENGAGKTTLMNILYGLIKPDSGCIYLRGDLAEITSPKDSISQGIAMVHQHFMLVPRFSVVENVVLGLSTPQGPILSTHDAAQRVTALSRSYGLQVDPGAEVGDLSVGEQQRVEIIKALYRDADILILDEPTAVLTPQEVDQLFNVLRAFTEEGHAVVFISHKLNEVLSISHRISVLRDGMMLGTVETKDATRSQLAEMMVGRPVDMEVGEKPPTGTEVVLALQEVSALNDRGLTGLKNVSLKVHAGEILGVAGVDGNGQRELAEVIAGLRPISGGAIQLQGQDISQQSPRQAIDMGIAHIPEDRQESGLLSNLPVWRSMLLGKHQSKPYASAGTLRRKTIDSMVKGLIQEYDIRPPDAEWQAGLFSGGNQQKFILARELSRDPKLLIASQPTRGLDVRTTEYVRQKLLEERRAGKALLLISTDLQEILALSDRIAVLYEGCVMAIIGRELATPERLGLLMAGVDIVDSMQYED